MSLINDALKKARLDADRQEARKRGDLYSTAPSHVPVRRRIGLPGLLGIGILILAGVLLTRMPWLSTELPAVGLTETGQAAEPEADASLDAAGLPVDPEPDAPRPEPTESSPDPLGRSRRPTERFPADTAERIPADATTAEASRTRPRNRPKVQSRRRPAGRIPARPSSQPPQGKKPPIDSVDGKSFLRKVLVPGGANLVLSGIAWSDTHPVAVISGSIVGTGDFVGGFKVVKIEPNSVELQRDESTFTIRLR